MTLKIDIHTHILPKELPRWKEKFGYGGFIQLEHHKPCCARMLKDDGTFFREIEENCWNPEVRISKKTDEHHVQVLSTVPVLFSYWAKPKDGLDIAHFLNDHIAEITQESPSRFVGLGTLPLQDPNLAIQELERCMKELKLQGVQIGSHINGWNLDAPELFPVLQAAEKLGAAVFVHPWDMMGGERLKKYWLQWLVGMPAEVSQAICSMIFAGIFEKLPNLRVAFAHGGGAFPGTFGRVQRGFDVRPDLCAKENSISPRETLGKFWVDSLVHDPRMLDHVVKLFGEDRVALGTDYPFPLGEEKHGQMIEMMDWSTDLKNKLLSKNALKWLGLSEKRFQ